MKKGSLVHLCNSVHVLICRLMIRGKEECSLNVKWSAVRFLENFSFFVFRVMSPLYCSQKLPFFTKSKHFHKNKENAERYNSSHTEMSFS